MTDFFDLHVSGNIEDSLSTKLGWKRVVKPFETSSKDVQQEARKIRGKAEVIIASGNDVTNRKASECWEVDMVGSPETHDEKDFMHQMNSGLDYTIARAATERVISVEFCFSSVLSSSGRKRAQILARMAQNVRICRDSHCNMVITSGAKDKYGLRSPRDLMAFGVILGMTLDEAKAALSLNPESILKRTEDRKNPNIILKGLEVKIWGSKQKEKRIYGWY